MKYIGLVVAIVVAMAVGFLVLNSSKKEPEAAPTQQVIVTTAAEPAIKEVLIYAAAREIPIGSKIDGNMLTTLKWPEHLVVEGFIRAGDGAQHVIGKVARATFRRDEPLNATKLVNPDDPSFLAGDLPKGMRVITIQTDEIEGVAGFVFPGDRVDILVTHTVFKEGVSEKDIEEAQSIQELMEKATETLLYDLRVLAVDQRATSGNEQGEGIVVPGSISLEVTPEQAQKLKLAANLGQLSLALRSLEDKGALESVAITRQSGISQSIPVKVEEAEQDEKEPVRVIRGTVAEEIQEDDE